MGEKRGRKREIGHEDKWMNRRGSVKWGKLKGMRRCNNENQRGWRRAAEQKHDGLD